MADEGKTKTTCRLFVIMARESKTAVIFRRGPSRWVQLIRWHTETDTFEPGQWFHGRVYEKRCDLSPDGKHLIYFASKQHVKSGPSSWTAISHPPYLTAVAFWPKGDCWDGGGLFESEKRVWLNHDGFQAKQELATFPAGIKVQPGACHGEDGPVFVRRLERDGWQYTICDDGWVVRCRKPSPAGGYSLEMKWKGSHFAHPLTYRIRDWELEEYFPLTGVGWADFDQGGRLVFVKAGQIYSGTYMRNESVNEQLLADFNDNKPENVAPPEWATKW